LLLSHAIFGSVIAGGESRPVRIFRISFGSNLNLDIVDLLTHFNPRFGASEQSNEMFIQTEPTPNPSSLKFIPGVPVMTTGTADFPDPESSARSPLAGRLFEIDGIMGVYLGADFVTVSKAEGTEWHHLKPAILGIIMEHFTAGLPVIDADPTGACGPEVDQADSEIVGQIVALLDEKVRPAVANDGGDIVFHGFERGVVYLQMQGACSGCPSSTMTLKHGIENLLRHYVPEVVEVRAV
jgi:Fe-S cluster biogenesis protein NfuA